MKDWMDGRHGYVHDKKPAIIFCIILENWISIKLFTEDNQDWISKIEKNRKIYNADMMCGCEPQVDWLMTQEDQQFHEMFNLGEPRKRSAVFNISEHIQRCQKWGMATMLFGWLSSYVVETGAHPRNLGKWTYLMIFNAYKIVRVVMEYWPCIPSMLQR